MKKYRLVLALALVVGLLAGVFTTPAVADPEPGDKIQIPIIGAVTGDFTDAETWIQVQAQSDDTGAVVFFWSGDYPQVCPTNADGPCGHLCLTPKDNEETWTIKDPQILAACPDGAKSAIIYFLQDDTDVDGVHDAIEACDAAAGITTYTAWKTWKDKWESGSAGWIRGGQGQAVVHRRMVGPAPDLIGVASDYVGIAPSMDGEWIGDGNTRSYYAPISMDAYHGFETVFHIQNSGQICTSITVYYQNQETCTVDYTEYVGDLAPGETIDVLVPDLGPDWLGSARIEAQTALGIIVDQFGRGLLLTHRANGPWVGDTVIYADLLYREYNGWVSGIQVQNTSPAAKTWVQVEFFDNSGDFLGLYGDWLCEDGATTFYLPSVDFLGGEYIGGAVVKSLQNLPLHGEWLDGQDIFAVVNLQNDYTDQGLSYNAHPEHEKRDMWVWDLPMIVKDHQGVTSEIAIRNNSNCTKLRAYIDFYNENGWVTSLPGLIIDPEHVEIYKLGQLGALLPPGFNGAASVYFYIEENFCAPDSPWYNVAMPSVIVKQEDTLVPGGSDRYSGYEGIPVYFYHEPCKGDVFGVVTDCYEDEIHEPLMGVEVSLDSVADGTTSSTGHYFIGDVPEGPYTASASKTGYLTREKPVTVICAEDVFLDFELACLNPLTITVKSSTDPYPPIQGATVVVTYTNPYDAGTDTQSELTNASGQAVFDIPILCDTGPQSVVYSASAAGFDTNSDTMSQWGEGPCDAYASDEIQLNSHAFVQGRVWCDGLVSDNDYFDVGEEQAGVLVKLYTNNVAKFLDDRTTDADGFYKFEVGNDLYPDFDFVDATDDLDVVANTQKVDVDNLLPDETRVVNFNICP